jgi:hypothetical protein
VIAEHRTRVGSPGGVSSSGYCSRASAAPLGNSAKLAAGKAADIKTDVGGFSILQAESREAVAALLKDHPHFKMPGATVEVHEYLPLPGM